MATTPITPHPLISRLKHLGNIEEITLEKAFAARFLRLGLSALILSRERNDYTQGNKGAAKDAFGKFEECLEEDGITFSQFAEIVGDKMISESEYETMKTEATTR